MKIEYGGAAAEGARHAIGNGGMLMYGIGPNFEYVFAPPYSSPPAASMQLLPGDAAARSDSERISGTAMWVHRLFDVRGAATARLNDFLLPDRDLFVREIEAEADAAFQFVIAPAPGVRIDGGIVREFGEVDRAAVSALLAYTKGPTFLAYDPVTTETELLVTVQGEAELAEEPSGALSIRVRAGRSRIVLAAGDRRPTLLRDTAEALADQAGMLRDATAAYWRAFTARRANFAALIPASHPLRDQMLRAIDSVSVLIKCHQSASGGVAPGHRYSPMAYVRDMAGVFRGLLALGYREEARAILSFWKRKWDRFGDLQNAEEMGDDSVRLSGGNNEVEVPAYVIHCVFEYAEQSGEESFVDELRPMLEWAFEVQLPHLAGGMTEFSNDETYIAGGVFPRHLMFQGSAESTLLFIVGGEKLIRWAKRRRWWSGDRLERARKAVGGAASTFKANFVEGDVLFANQPERERLAGKPRFQFGFCDAHGSLDGRLVNRWLEANEQGYYLCAECKGRAMPEPGVDHAKRYALNSVSLLPLYVGGGPLSAAEAALYAAPGFRKFEKEGRIPSDLGGTRALGYDCGLMLYNAVKLGDPLTERLLGKALELTDPTGAWAEYYDDERPADCCRARPWESAINIEAIIAYIRSLAEEV